jgi:hypothetical protein
MIGYSAYCPSKFAVRGLAESLRNEVGNSSTDALHTLLYLARHCLTVSVLTSCEVALSSRHLLQAYIN